MTSRTPEQYDWTKALFNDRRLTKNFTSPRRSEITHVTLHHMTIVVPADEPRSTVAVEGAYDTWMGGRAASANYGVSGELVWQYVSDFDAAWSDANSTSNHSTLSIEHANSTAGPGWEISDATMRTGQRLVACLHRLYGLGRPSRETVRVHRDYYATACPGPYMMARLDEYIAAAAQFYDHPDADPAPVQDPVPADPLDVLDPANYPDADHPTRNATGPQITWLGERLVVHEFGKHYQSGPGPNWSDADRENVRDFQLDQGWTGDGADGYPGPATLRRLASEPRTAPPEPKTVEIPVMLMPLAGYNADDAPGVTRWEQNVKGALTLVTKEKPTILGVTELSAKAPVEMRDAFDKGATAYTRHGGSDGRYPYIRDSHSTEHIAHGTFEAAKDTLFNDDDKQCGWTIDVVEGVRVAVGVAHAENQNGIDRTTGKDADDLRVAQALSWEKQLRAKASEHGADHVLLMGDFNSRGAVRDALEPLGWTACQTPGRATGWDHEGGSVADWIFVLDGELDSEVHENPYSDHTYITAVWTVEA